jgi:aryl-alcohol dehydrogenase-like predicted oxidoreductase
LYPVPPDAKYGGATEEIIGNYLSKHPGVREKLVVATKVSGPTTSNWIPANREKALNGSWDDTAPLPRLKPEQIKRACHASLKRMKTDYIDLYQLHWPDRYTPLWGSFVYVFPPPTSGLCLLALTPSPRALKNQVSEEHGGQAYAAAA